MCGIIGILRRRDSVSQDQCFIEDALRSMYFRGPDSQKILQPSPNYIAGFVRLAIRDRRSIADQPMVSPCGRYVLSYNGEIYNTSEILSRLPRDSAELRTSSDTEVLLHALTQLGPEATLRLADGIFAFAFYDKLTGSLVLARDRVGVKPLYFAYSSKTLIYSSHYDHLLRHPDFRSESIAPSSVRTYLQLGYIPGGTGLYTSTEFLEAGTWVAVSPDWSIARRRYYQFPLQLQPSGDCADLAERLETAVRSQLVSDVPVGSFLSGGIDSPLVSYYAKRAAPNLRSFTVGISDAALDETVASQEYASILGLHQQLTSVHASSMHRLVPDHFKAFPEPFGDFSSLPTLQLCEVARRKVTVALSGDGGDELFWGYPRAQRTRGLDAVLRVGKFARPIALAWSRLKFWRTPIPSDALHCSDLIEYLYRTLYITGAKKWVPRLVAAPDDFGDSYCKRMHDLVRSAPGFTSAMFISRLMEVELHLPRVLLKVDRSSMFHSLEVRVPLLSNRLLEAAAGTPPEQCINGRHGKANLRGILFAATSSPTCFAPKRGFIVPIDAWLRGPLRSELSETLVNPPTPMQCILDHQALQDLLSGHLAGRESSGWLLWSIFSLFRWQRNLS